MVFLVVAGFSANRAEAEFQGYTAEMVQAHKLPTQLDPPWFTRYRPKFLRPSTTPLTSHEDDYLRISSETAGVAYVYPWKADCHRGYVVKWSCRYISGDYHQIKINDGKYREDIKYTPTGLTFIKNNQHIEVDTTQFHAYTLIRRDRNIRFLIDGKLRLEARFDAFHNLRGVVFGNSTDPGQPGCMDFKYFVFDETPDESLLPPAEAPRKPFPRSSEQAQALADSSIRLENENMAILLDKTTGGMTSIENKLADEHYFLDDVAFELELGTHLERGTVGVLTPDACTMDKLERDGNEVTYSFTKDSVTIEVRYQLGESDAFAIKTVRAKYDGPGPFNVSRMEMFNWDIFPRPVRAIPYYGYNVSGGWSSIDDGEEVPPCANSTAFFYRANKGGIVSTVTCDFALLKNDVNEARYRSVYWPGAILDAGNVFESERGIIGVYRRNGYFHKTVEPGLSLQYSRYPDVDTTLDRGENEAMSGIIRRLVPPGIHYCWVNSWAVGTPGTITNQKQLKRHQECIDTVTQLEPFKCYLLPTWNGLCTEFQQHGRRMPTTPNPYALQQFDYLTQRNMTGLGWIGFSNNYPIFPRRDGADVSATYDQDLLTLQADGQRDKRNIASSKQYTDFILKTVCQFKKDFPRMMGWVYDFLNIRPDFDPEHGYLPGRGSLYGQWRYVRDLNRNIFQTFPDMMMGGWLGWQYLGPWLAEGMIQSHNLIDHHVYNQRNFIDFHIDHQFANNVRLGNWFCNNCKFYPRSTMDGCVSHNGHDMPAWDWGGWRYNLLSQLASSQNTGFLANLPNEAAGESLNDDELTFLKKWIHWQKEHEAYYRQDRELFGEPRRTGIDGYAYGNGKDSIIFLCNPTYRTHEVALPISDAIHLPKGQNYTVKELYPEERYRMGLKNGVFDYGTSFITSVPPQTVMVLEVKPDDAKKALLLGVAGDVHRDQDHFVLRGLAGPSGQSRLVAVRLPRHYQGEAQVRVNGQVLPTTKRGRLLLGRVRFAQDPIEPEVTNYRITQTNDGLRVKAQIPAPLLAQSVLADQQRPIPKELATQEWLTRIACLGWHRFIIYLPIDPTVARDCLYSNPKEIQKRFDIKAQLNGKSIPVYSNILGKTKSFSVRRRWAGFFIDATEAIEYGKTNELQLDMPWISEDRFYGIYLPNLTRQIVTDFIVGPPPVELHVVDATEAADPFYPVPAVAEQNGQQVVYLRLGLKAQQPVSINPSAITVSHGQKLAMIVTGHDPRWLMDEESTRQGKIILGRKTKHVTLQLSGTDETVISLGSDQGQCVFTLGSVFTQWREKGDPFEPYVTKLPWPGKQAKVTVEMVGPLEEKRFVVDTFE